MGQWDDANRGLTKEEAEIGRFFMTIWVRRGYFKL